MLEWWSMMNNLSLINFTFLYFRSYELKRLCLWEENEEGSGWFWRPQKLLQCLSLYKGGEALNSLYTKMRLVVSRRQHARQWMQILCVVILVGGTVFMVLDLLKMLGFLRGTCPVSLTRLSLVRTISSDPRSRSVQIQEETYRFLSGPVNWPRTNPYSPNRPLWTVLTDGRSVKSDRGFEKMKTMFEELLNKSENVRAQKSSTKFQNTKTSGKHSKKREHELVWVST